MFVEEGKYVVKENNMPEYITDDIEISSDSVKKILVNKILVKKILMRKVK